MSSQMSFETPSHQDMGLNDQENSRIRLLPWGVSRGLGLGGGRIRTWLDMLANELSRCQKGDLKFTSLR